MQFHFILHFTIMQSSIFCLLVFKIFYLVSWLFLAALGLQCCAQALQRRRVGAAFHCSAQASQSTGSRVHGLLQLQLMGPVVVAFGLQSAGSIVVAHEFNCSEACGTLPDQESNPSLLHWQADSQPLNGQGKPSQFCFKKESRIGIFPKMALLVKKKKYSVK